MKNLSPAVSAKHAPVALNSRFIPATARSKPVSKPTQRPKPTNCFEEMGHSMEWAAYNVWFADKTKAIRNFFFYPFFTKAEAENFIEDVLKPSFPDEKFTISASSWIGSQEDRSLPHDPEYMTKMSENPYFHMWMLEVKRYKNSDKYQQILKAKQERIEAAIAECKQQQGVH